MYHLVNNLTNRSGDALAGYYVKLKDADGNYASLYADVSGTPIISVSGVADTAVTDGNGLYDIYVDDGAYDIEFFDKADINQRILTIPDVPMFTLQVGPSDVTAAVEAAATTTADRVSVAADRAQVEAALASAQAAADLAVAGLATEKHFTDATLAAAITAGLAAVADTEYFRATGDDVDYIGVYQDNAGSAVEKGRYAKPSAIDEAVAALDTAAADVGGVKTYLGTDLSRSTVTLGTTAPNSLAGSNSFVWFYSGDAAQEGDTLQSVTLNISAAGTGQVLIGRIAPGSANLQLIAKYNVTPVGGVQTFAIPGTPELTKGDLIGYKRLTGGQVMTDNPGTKSNSLSMANGAVVNVGDTVAYASNDNRIALSFTVSRRGETIAEQYSFSRLPLDLSADWNHALGYGQSKVIGADAIPPMNTTPSTQHRTFGKGVKMAKSGIGNTTVDDGTIAYLAEDAANPTIGTTGTYGETFCTQFAKSFTRRYARTNGTPPTWFCSVAGKGGTPLRDLQPYASHYANFSYHLEAAAREAAELGLSYACPIIVMMESESDQSLSTTKADFKARMIRFIERAKLEVESRAPGTQAPQFLFFTSCAYITTSWGATEATLELCDERDDCHYVLPDYRLPYINNIHLTPAGEDLAGEYVSRVVHELARGIEPGRVRWLGASATGTTLTVMASAPTALALNTTIIANTSDGNYGFKVQDGTGTLTLSGIAVGTATFNPATGLYETPITMTLNRALGTSPVLRYALDAAPTGYAVTNSATGNVFDTTTETVTINGTSYTLAHAAPPCSLSVFVTE